MDKFYICNEFDIKKKRKNLEESKTGQIGGC